MNISGVDILQLKSELRNQKLEVKFAARTKFERGKNVLSALATAMPAKKNEQWNLHIFEVKASDRLYLSLFFTVFLCKSRYSVPFVCSIDIFPTVRLDETVRNPNLTISGFCSITPALKAKPLSGLTVAPQTNPTLLSKYIYNLYYSTLL